MARLRIFLFGLLAVGVLGHVVIYANRGAEQFQAKLQASVEAKLTGLSERWAKVSVDGRDAVLAGQAVLENERRATVDKIREVVMAVPGIRTLRDGSTSAYADAGAMRTAINEKCGEAVRTFSDGWLACSVTDKEIVLTGSASTEALRKEAVEKVKDRVEAIAGARRLKLTDKTDSHYVSGEALRKALTEACAKVVAEFPLNWLACVIDGRNVSLGGIAPTDAERKARVAQVTGALKAVPGAGSVIDKTGTMSALDSAEACQQVLDQINRGKSIGFELKQPTLAAASHALLNEIVTTIKRCGTLKIEIVGHTASSGNQGADRVLSTARAHAVARYLRQYGIAADRLVASGLGSSKPVADNETEQGRAKNDRIEFRVAK